MVVSFPCDVISRDEAFKAFQAFAHFNHHAQCWQLVGGEETPTRLIPKLILLGVEDGEVRLIAPG